MSAEEPSRAWVHGTQVRTTSGLVVDVTTDGTSVTFRDFFSGYDRAFVLPDEKEGEAGFRRCLALNHEPDYALLHARYGPFQEVCLVASEPTTGAAVGGANFIAAPADTGGRIVTANLNYIFVDETARGQGRFRTLLSAVREIVGTSFVWGAGAMRRTAAGVLVFLEQNDPFLMSAEAYERDTRFTGLDQIDRLRIWARCGAKVVDFPYVQPPLSGDQAADTTLLYSVLGADGPTLEPRVLEGHLRRFFGISVLKGAPIDDEPSAARQLAELARRSRDRAPVELLDPGPLLEELRGARPAGGAGSFREALRRRKRT